MKVFISHINEDSKLASVLKQWIESTFLGEVEVFVSSEPVDNRPGERWFEKIENELEQSKLLIILASKESVVRPWINFETGAGWIKKIPVIPICHTNITKNNLPLPLLHFQALDLSEDNFSLILLQAICSHLNFKKLPPIPFNEMTRDLFLALGKNNENKIEVEDISNYGLVDHFVFSEESMEKITNLLTIVSEETKTIGEEAEKSTRQVLEVNSKPSLGNSKHVQRISRELAKKIEDYAKVIHGVNVEYSDRVLQIEKSIGFILNADEIKNQEEKNGLEAVFINFKFLRDNCITAREAMVSMGNTMEAFPNIEKELKKSMKTGSDSIKELVENIDKTTGMCTKIMFKIEQLTKNSYSSIN